MTHDRVCVVCIECGETAGGPARREDLGGW